MELINPLDVRMATNKMGWNKNLSYGHYYGSNFITTQNSMLDQVMAKVVFLFPQPGHAEGFLR